MPARAHEEMYTAIFRAMLMRLYGDMTTAARRRQLTESNIARLEEYSLSFLNDTSEFADQFPGIDPESVISLVRQEFEQMTAVIRAARVHGLSKEN